MAPPSTSDDPGMMGGDNTLDGPLAPMVLSEVSMDTDLLMLVVSMFKILLQGKLPAKMALPGVPTTAFAPMRGTRSPRACSVDDTNSSQLSLSPTSTWGGREEGRGQGREEVGRVRKQ